MGFKSQKPQMLNGKAYTLPTYKAKDCNDYQNDANTQMGNTDIYDVYSNVCNSGSKGAKNGKVSASSKAAIITAAGDSNVQAGCSAEYDPCIDDKTATYLNTPAVLNAIHVVPSLIPGGSWVRFHPPHRHVFV
jgi:hypothetical protein